MAEITSDDIKRFNDRLQATSKSVGNRQIAVDSMAIRELVRDEQKVTERMVQIYLTMAQGNPSYFQGAMMLATAYQIEFGDPFLIQDVLTQAKDAGGEEALRRIQALADGPAVRADIPERTAARDWWSSTSKQVAKCDNCRASLIRGAGFLISGRGFQIKTPFGSKQFSLGQELVCEACFGDIRFKGR